MEQENSYDENFYQDRKNGIKVIADQMARKFFSYDVNIPKYQGISKQKMFELLLGNKNDNLISIKSDENELQKNFRLNQKDIKDPTKINQIQELNSNINTNFNTKENNQNTIINTNYNTGSNMNTNSNNDKYNENEMYSNINTKRKEASFIDESIYDNQNLQEKETKEIEVSIEKISSNDFSDDSFENVNLANNYYKNNKKVEKFKKRNIYERSKVDIERKENKLKKKRKENKKKKLKELKLYPTIDPYSEEIIENIEYIPIEERAAKIHSMKILQNIVNEERKKIKQQEKEMAEIKKCKISNKKFDQDNWNKFIKRQKKWNKKIQYKNRAAIFLRDSEENENFFKPKINSRSKLIIEGIEEENKNYIDEVYNRLYYDFEEHKERQKYRNQQSLPSFRPKIIKCCSQKMFGLDSKRPKGCETNLLVHLINKKKSKKSYILNKSMEQKGKELFIDSCNDFKKYYEKINKNENIKNKYMKFINKSQQTNQQTQNNYSKLNCSQASSNLINSNYIIMDYPKLNQKGKSKSNSSTPFLPLTIKKMIENNCKEEEKSMELRNKNSLFQQNLDREKYHFNLSHYNIEESKEKSKNGKCIDSEKESLSLYSKRNENRDSHKVNENPELSQKKEELLAKLEKGTKKENESFEEDKNIKNGDDMYKLNIRDTTPLFMKEDIILASKDYSDFFDVNFDEEI